MSTRAPMSKRTVLFGSTGTTHGSRPARATCVMTCIQTKTTGKEGCAARCLLARNTSFASSCVYKRGHHRVRRPAASFDSERPGVEDAKHSRLGSVSHLSLLFPCFPRIELQRNIPLYQWWFLRREAELAHLLAFLAIEHLQVADPLIQRGKAPVLHPSPP